ncbi:MAG: TatD DNase family protein [Alphaproteobacteria bacterium]|jgi:TatD DNase family protein
MKTYSGDHTQGCHKCGGFPGSLKTPVTKLIQCLQCGFFTCNKHLKGGFSKICPNCGGGGKNLRQVMNKQSHQRTKSGGMPGHVAAKTQAKKDDLSEAVADESSTFGGGGPTSGSFSGASSSEQSDSKSEGNKKASPSGTQGPVSDSRVEEAMVSSVKKDVDTLRNQMDSLHELATVTKQELSILRENSERESQHTELLVEEHIDSEQSLDDLLKSNDNDIATPLTSTISQITVDDEEHDESIDFEALAQIDQLLKEQEQGISLTKKIIADSYFRVESQEGLNTCKDYLFNGKGSIHILSVEASETKIIRDLQVIIKEKEHIFAATAFTPKSIQNGKKPDINELKSLLNKKKKFIAIGEIMLDLHFSPHTIAIQKEMFIEQAMLSVEKNMPLFISSKKADAEVYQLLNKLRNDGVKVQGIIVPIVRTVEMFQMVLDHGFHLLLRPEITHDNEDLYRECLKELPIEKLLLASGVEISPPKKYFGRWNSPKYINETITYAADMFKIEPNAFIKQMSINFNKLFNSDPEAGDDEFDFTPTAMNPTLTMTEEKLLDNDVDEDGDELFIKEINDYALVGNIYFDRDHRLLIYTPKEGFIGSDKFIYTVTDGRGGFDTATVTINVAREYTENDAENA